MYYMYLLQSPKADDIYIGFTPDLRRRMREHRTEHRRWNLVYYEAYVSEKDARLREQRLKHHGSGKVELKKRLRHSFELHSQTGAG
jgi:putative endonuclease